MNWSDLVVVGLIVGFGFIGMKKGFIFSIFKLVSFLVSAFISIKFYPFVANILSKTSLYGKIQTSIYDNLMLQQGAKGAGVSSMAQNAATDAVMDNLHLPDFLRNTVLSKVGDVSKKIPVSEIMEKISTALTDVVIGLISLIILYILVRIGLTFLRFLLQGVAKLPIFKQMDKLGGFAFGAVEGLLTIYIVLAILMIFQASPKFNGVFEAINTSSVAKFFYQNNFIVDFMFPDKIL